MKTRLIWIALLLAGACGDPSEPSATGGSAGRGAAAASDPQPIPEMAARSLLLVSIDTLRADRLGCYGYELAETPTLDRLAREGVLFEQVTSCVPLTLPSHTTLLTGLIPEYHGVRDNGTFRAAAELETLAERLHAAGRRTGGFVSAFVLDAQFGLDQGFETFGGVRPHALTLGGGYEERPALQTNAEALAWIDEIPDDASFFLFVHYFEPHRPYRPVTGIPARMRERPYDAEVAAADHALDSLLAGLQARHRLADTLVAVTSDHGESLGEHEESTHGFFVYEGVLHVPLVLWHPGWSLHRRVPERVGLVDVMPTLLDLIGLDPPRLPPPAHSLVGLIRGETEAPRPVYFECFAPRFSYGWAPLRGITFLDHKLIQAPRPELYDLSHDRAEQNDLHAEKPEILSALTKRLEALVEANREVRPALQAEREASPEVLERLAALGYVRDGSNRSVDSQGIDPKDGFQKVKRRDLAFDYYERGEYAKALAIIEEILAEDPGNATFQSHAGSLLVSLGRHAEAIPHLRASLKRLPTAGNAFNLAESLAALGKNDEAEQRYRESLDLNPKHLPARLRLGDLFARTGRKDEARECYETFLAIWNGAPRVATQVRRKIERLRR